MADIPSILKKTIQERGFTQEEFADETGIAYATLKDYLSGKTKFDYEVLLIFAEKLGCSLDYLMGLSESPVREYHEIAEVIGLSDRAIDVLKENKNNILFNELLEEIMVDKSLMNDISLFVAATKPVNEGIKEVTSIAEEKINKELGEGDYLPYEYQLDMEKQIMINLVMDIVGFKKKLSKDLAERITEQVGMTPKELYSAFASILKNPIGGQ